MTNPFLVYRELLDSYVLARRRGWSDERYCELVEALSEAVAAVEGHGFDETPLTIEPALAGAVGCGALLVKNDTGNVAGSHKARHLFGLLLDLYVREFDRRRPFAIASCGNAALAAAVLARAIDHPLDVFIPADANPRVVERLQVLGARLHVCDRRAGEPGDPAYLRFKEHLGGGAIAFSCQAVDAPAAIDGGRTIMWEIAAELHRREGVPVHVDSMYVQVGGGALASACARALNDAVDRGWLACLPQLCAVQTEGAAPLDRAWRLLRERAARDELVRYAQQHAGELMWAWETTPASAATGILDDVTYDWLGVVEGMAASGGGTVVALEHEVLEANRLARMHTSIPVDHTGSAGLAGVVHDRGRRGHERIVVLFTGKAR